MKDLKSHLFLALTAAWRRRYIIAIPLLVMPLLALGIGQLTPDIYRSHTSMLIQESAKMNPFLHDIAVETQFTERINALRTLLKSRHVLSTVARERGLIDDKTSDAQSERIIGQLAASLTVSQTGKDFVTISLSSSKPTGMKELLESVSHHFIEQLLAPERSSIDDSSRFLAMHINKRLEELQIAEQALANFQNQNPTTTPEFLNENLSRLAMLKQNLAEKEALLAGANKGLGSLDQQLSRTNPVLGRIEEKIIEYRSELTLLTARYTDSHSAVIAVKRELERLESEREHLLKEGHESLSSDVLWDIASSKTTGDQNSVRPLLITQLENLQVARSQFESLKEETKAIKGMIESLEKQNSRYGDVSKTLTTLKREVEFKRRLYDELVDRYEMAKLTGSLGAFEHSKRVKIIDLPYTPSAKANMPKILYAVIGLIAGIAVGLGLTVLLELTDTRIYQPQTLATLCAAPVLSVIPRIHGNPERGL